MSSNRNRLANIFLSLVLLMAFSFVAETASAEKERAGKAERSDKRAEQMKKFQEKRLKRLVEEVGLEEKKAATVNQILAKYTEKRKKMGQKKQEEMKKLKSSLETGSPADSQLQTSIQQIQKMDQDLVALQTQEWKEVAPHLSTQEQAKFLVFKQGSRSGRRGQTGRQPRKRRQ